MKHLKPYQTPGEYLAELFGPPTSKPRCRCHINAKYNNRTAWKTGKLPKPCPLQGHDEDIKNGTLP